MSVLEKEIRNRNADSAYVQLIDMGLIQESWDEDDAFVSAMDELFPICSRKSRTQNQFGG